MPHFSELTPRPADALLGLMAAYRADPRTDKIDLGVGVYRDQTGNTPVLAAVRDAERRLAETQTTKVYEGPQGNLAYCEAIQTMVRGSDPSGCAITFATPGGTGGLSLGMSLYRRTRENGRVWISRPTWPNHQHIAQTVGLQVGSYGYADATDPGVDLDRMLSDLGEAKRGDMVLVQGPCHNPTGIDLSHDQWLTLADFCQEKGLLPLIDTAYHGFAASLDDDIAGVQAFLQKCADVLVVYSCSKNFGLYRERSGALIVQTDDEKSLEAVRTHLADVARAIYSMPPAHGPAIVATILGDADLRKAWTEELASMRTRMVELRRQLAAALQPRSNSYDPAVLNAQNGMFSQLPFVEGGIAELRERGLYIPGSGRLNIAGLVSEDIDRAAAEMSAYL
ncbi:amino acid aminotransferase [Parvularcula sp. LCG005]|uniref:amino acid aminotransferase n=1 Tax=Parvularcula sp. LCG005 TaxID=3078805 RepID=UPI00294301BE|nr:amino acid aminotransferase [Parvularcula sp. LCG005]WOI52707.1 amino acid aminotransferase [Parvularcula sp. LCG005]